MKNPMFDLAAAALDYFAALKREDSGDAAMADLARAAVAYAAEQTPPPDDPSDVFSDCAFG